MLYYDVCFIYAVSLLLILDYHFNYKFVDMQYISPYSNIICIKEVINSYVFYFPIKRNWRTYKQLFHMSEKLCSSSGISIHLTTIMDLRSHYN